MPTYKIAHITGQNVNVIIIPVNNNFGNRPPEEQDAMLQKFQAKALAAGLLGNVVPIWDGEDGKINFIAPANQRDFFRNVTQDFIKTHLNKSISW